MQKSKKLSLSIDWPVVVGEVCRLSNKSRRQLARSVGVQEAGLSRLATGLQRHPNLPLGVALLNEARVLGVRGLPVSVMYAE